MKVLHVIPALAPRYGGPSSVLPALCAALRAQGVETTIATTDADGSGRLAVATGVPTEYRGTQAIFFPRQFSESFKYSRPLAAWLTQNVHNFDVVHVHALLSHACLAAGWASRAAGVPYIVRPLGTLDPWSLGQKAVKKRFLLRGAGHRVLRDAAAIHYTSEREKSLVEASLAVGRGVVIPLGVDGIDAGARTGAPKLPREPYVLALSRLHPVKGLEALIAAFALASRRADHPGWRLVIAGDGDKPYVDGLKRLAADEAVEDRVQFAGWVEGAEKRRVLENASLFAVPSLHESFGVSLVEALACGVPAIVSEHVHLSDEIRDAGAGWVITLDPDPFAQSLVNAMASAAERARRGEAARLFARRFAWQTVACELVGLYERLIRLPCPD